MNWRATSVTVRGSAHVRSGLPNQDRTVFINGPRSSHAVIAVSDGHGGARHFRSNTGSDLAVNTSAPLVRDFLINETEMSIATPFSPTALDELKHQLIQRWLAAVEADFTNNPFSGDELSRVEQEEGATAREAVESNPALAYGATLLLVAASQSHLLYMQLGDGDILAVDAAGETTRPMRSDERLVANQTTSLCQPEAWNEFRVSVCSNAEQFPVLVLASTDGYSNSFRSEEDFLQIGRDYLEIVRQEGLEAVAPMLPEILTEASQQGSGDDITLGILYAARMAGKDSPSSAGDRAALTAAAVAKQATPRASGSALYQQLKARHSAQRRELEALAVKHQRDKAKIYRLRMIVLGLVAIAAGVFALYWAEHSNVRQSVPQPPPKQGEIPRKHEDKPGENPPEAAKQPQWVLLLGQNGAIALKKGTKIRASQIMDDVKKDFTYAKVDEEKPNGVTLTNLSGDEWKITGLDHTEITAGTRDQVTLTEGSTIQFNKNASATFTAQAVGELDRMKQ